MNNNIIIKQYCLLNISFKNSQYNIYPTAHLYIKNIYNDK